MAAPRCGRVPQTVYAERNARGFTPRAPARAGRPPWMAQKPPKMALIACMRKLIVRLNAMLAHNQTWSDQPT